MAYFTSSHAPALFAVSSQVLSSDCSCSVEVEQAARACAKKLAALHPQGPLHSGLGLGGLISEARELGLAISCSFIKQYFRSTSYVPGPVQEAEEVARSLFSQGRQNKPTNV